MSMSEQLPAEWKFASKLLPSAPRSRPEKHKTNSLDWLRLEAWTSRFSGYLLSDSIKGSVLPLHRLVPMAVLLWCSRVEKVIPNNFLGSKYFLSFKFPLYPTHLSLVVRFLVWRKLTLFTQHRNSTMDKHQVYQYKSFNQPNCFNPSHLWLQSLLGLWKVILLEKWRDLTTVFWWSLCLHYSGLSIPGAQWPSKTASLAHHHMPNSKENAAMLLRKTLVAWQKRGRCIDLNCMSLTIVLLMQASLK